ncbi:MAG: magnesium transporter CorA family protein [Clostridia bacterium]
MRSQWTEGEGVREGSRWPDRAAYVFIDLDVSSREETESTARRLFLPHPMVMNRLLEDTEPRAGVQVYPDVMAATILADLEGGTDKPLHIVLGKEFLLTAHEGVNPLIDDVWPIAYRRGVLKEGPDLVLYLILRHHLRAYQALIRKQESNYEAIHEMMLNHPYRNLAHRILASRQAFLRISRHLRPELPIAELLASSDFPYVRTDNRPYLQDLSTTMQNVVAEVQATREGLSSTVEGYTSLQSNEINKVMKFLTIISVLALPATTIASIYGMNFHDIPELTWSFGYWYSLGLMSAITGSLLFYMAWRGWFR